jgi:hypothetical protein
MSTPWSGHDALSGPVLLGVGPTPGSGDWAQLRDALLSVSPMTEQPQLGAPNKTTAILQKMFAFPRDHHINLRVAFGVVPARNNCWRPAQRRCPSW